MDFDNTLFIIGNGFDLKLGLKTTYLDFLNSLNDIKFDDFMIPLKKELTDKLKNHLVKLKYEDSLNFLFITNFNWSNYNRYFSRFKNNTILLSINNEDHYFDIKAFESKYNYDDAESVKEYMGIENFWAFYFKYLYNKNSISGTNWIDLENIIRKNLNDPYYSDKFKIFTHKYINTNTYNDMFFEIEFTLFKDLLKKYISNQENNTLKNRKNEHLLINDVHGIYPELFLKIDKSDIISFNYTKKLINTIIKNSNIYHIHGTSESNIILGSNSYDYMNNDKFSMGRHPFLMKERQILDYNKKSSFKLKSYKELVVIGHSLGQNDYDYFFYILDQNKDIEIYICYYSYYDNNGNLKNNKDSLTKNLYRMLYQYEKSRNIQIITELNISNKLHMIEIDIIWVK